MGKSYSFVARVVCLLSLLGAFASPAAEAASRAGTILPDQYIVIFKSDVDSAGVAASYGLRARKKISPQVSSFSFKGAPQAIEQLRKDPRVEWVEPDQIVTVAGGRQQGPTWALDRIDQRGQRSDGSYSYQFSGKGITAYIVDTGIRISHSEFQMGSGSRARVGGDYVYDGKNGEDCHGHGTHVAGILGGKTYGVAKDISLVSVRALNCNGESRLSDVISALNWVRVTGVRPAVVNLSIYSKYSVSFNRAVKNLADAGFVVVGAAGNESRDACAYSPGSAPDLITVGATTRQDMRLKMSNFGSCVDLYAPGEAVLSSYYDGDSEAWEMSGTSMASPLVAGVAALFLEAHPQATNMEVRDALMSSSSKGVIRGLASSSFNRLLYSFESASGSGDYISPHRAEIVSPPEGGKHRSGSTVRFVAEASDNKKVARVDFYVNEKLICRRTIAPWRCDWKHPGNMNVPVVHAEVVDTSGNSLSSPYRLYWFE